jgi:hypothetical protein
MIAQEEVKKFLDQNPELAEAMRVFEMSAESYSKAIEAMNPVVKYTSTSSRDLGPKSNA